MNRFFKHQLKLETIDFNYLQSQIKLSEATRFFLKLKL